jgi:COMPASS component SWD3
MSQPKPDRTDAILGGQNSLITDTVVLGGIEGIKHRLTSTDKQTQISALQEAFKYADKGIELLVEIWRDDLYKLKWDAFTLLRTRAEEKVKACLTEYNPWLNLQCIHTWNQDSTATSIAISPDGNTLFSGNLDKINVWNMQTKQQKSILFPYQETNALAVTPDGKTLICRGGYTSIISRDGHSYLLFNKENEALLRSLPGDAIYHGIDRGITLWNIETGEHRLIAQEYCPRISALVISPCQRFLIYGNGSYCGIRVRDLITGELLKNIKVSKNTVHALDISNDGKFIVGDSADVKVKIWDFKTRDLSIVFEHKDIVSSIAISSDDRTVVSGSRDKTIKVWDLQTNKIKFTLKGHKGWVYCVAISPDGNYIFSCSSDKTIRVWELHTGECVSVLTGHTELIHCLVVSPDGKTLISSSRDKTIKVWQR